MKKQNFVPELYSISVTNRLLVELESQLKQQKRLLELGKQNVVRLQEEIKDLKVVLKGLKS